MAVAARGSRSSTPRRTTTTSRPKAPSRRRRRRSGPAFGMYSVQGLTVRSPSVDVSIPDSLSGIVSGVIGLDDSAQFVHTDHTHGHDAPPPAAFVSAPPCSTYWGQNAGDRVHQPVRLGHAAVRPVRLHPAADQGRLRPLRVELRRGRARRSRSSTPTPRRRSLQDVNQWSANRGLPQFTGHQFTQVVAPGTYKHPENGAEAGPAGLVRRGDPGRRSRARHGTRRRTSSTSARRTTSRTSTPRSTTSSTSTSRQIVTNSYGFDTELLPRRLHQARGGHDHAGRHRGHRHLLLVR